VPGPRGFHLRLPRRSGRCGALPASPADVGGHRCGGEPLDRDHWGRGLRGPR
jgi:hypothetical protein